MLVLAVGSRCGQMRQRTWPRNRTERIASVGWSLRKPSRMWVLCGSARLDWIEFDSVRFGSLGFSSVLFNLVRLCWLVAITAARVEASAQNRSAQKSAPNSERKFGKLARRRIARDSCSLGRERFAALTRACNRSGGCKGTAKGAEHTAVKSAVHCTRHWIGRPG